MKNSSVKFTYIFTIIGTVFLSINLKKNYLDGIWDYFFVIIIFMLNLNEFIKNFKSKKDEKNIKF